MSKRWTIEVTEEQARVIEHCLQVVARTRLGQFSELTQLLMDTKLLRAASTERQGMVATRLHRILFAVKSVAFSELAVDDGRSYGVGHDMKTDRIWDLYVAIRNTIARSKDDPETRWLVTGDDPATRMVSDWPMAVVRPVPAEEGA